jgi:hypothetical protein
MWAQAHTHAKKGARIGIDGENVIAMGVGAAHAHGPSHCDVEGKVFFLSPESESRGPSVLIRQARALAAFLALLVLAAHQQAKARKRKEDMVCCTPPQVSTLTSMTSGGAWLLL